MRRFLLDPINEVRTFVVTQVQGARVVWDAVFVLKDNGQFLEFLLSDHMNSGKMTRRRGKAAFIGQVLIHEGSGICLRGKEPLHEVKAIQSGWRGHW